MKRSATKRRQAEPELARWRDQPDLCKLHGSCDWSIENGVLRRDKHFNQIDDLIHRDIAIGTPGTGKRTLAKNLFAADWQNAIEKIKKAEIISIVGYTFPETDNVFRLELLDAIAANTSLKKVWIVLGGRSERGSRAESIIKNAIRSSKKEEIVELLPEYAQDHLPARRTLDL